ncbi:MAG: PAS domain-containing sensor histidine kinase [Acidobacteriota bacterium]|nr:PAS domain-containing sensor histidine kinase [Acidobacteriota bacterium]
MAAPAPTDPHRPGTRPSRLTYDQRILLMAIGAGVPGALVAFVLIWTGGYTPKVEWTLSVFIVVVWLGVAFTLRERVVTPLQTLSNLLAALRESDFSIRARSARADDSLSGVTLEVNALSETLREQRLGALEAGALLRTVMAEIDVAVFTFDGHRTLRLVNRAGERLLGRTAEDLLGRTAAAIGLADCLEGPAPRIIDVAFPGGVGRWEIRRTTFRQGGLPHQLLVLSDVSRPLRDEERQAWQRLIRVLGHEINNSLAPIKSIAGSLEGLFSRAPMPDDWREDMRSGLAVIAARSDSLSRFTNAYARLARLPEPRRGPVQIGPLLQRVAGLETRQTVAVRPGPDLVISADADQLEQLLINLVRNAVDAAQDTGGGVTTGWERIGARIEIRVEDEGPGLPTASNLFVPFFTTKPGGSGIGLVLSRQIAEAHGGALTLENRRDRPGCLARLQLPLAFDERDPIQPARSGSPAPY